MNISINNFIWLLLLGLYRISALAPAGNRPFSEIRLRPKCSQISVFGQICKTVHTNTATFCISPSFKQVWTWCCHIFDEFVYFVEISPPSDDRRDLMLGIMHADFKYPSGLSSFINKSQTGQVCVVQSGSGRIYRTWIQYSPKHLGINSSSINTHSSDAHKRSAISVSV